MTEPRFESKQCMSPEPMPRNHSKKKKITITAFVKWHKLCDLWPRAIVIFGWMIGWMNTRWMEWLFVIWFILPCKFKLLYLLLNNGQTEH